MIVRSWADIPGWTCARLLELYDEVAERWPDGLLVEVGCAYGRSIAYLAKRAPNADITGVDTWAEHMGGDNLPPDVFASLVAKGSPADACAAMLRDARALVHLRQAPSVDAAADWNEGEADFVFLDADHSYEAVHADILAWLPKVSPGGWLAGHDVNAHYPGVERAVRELLPDAEVRSNVDGWGGVWIHRVPA